MPVYPRWRGELSHKTAFFPRLHGLSPLARGTHLHSILFGRKARFIPAGAGNSGIGSTNTTCAPVYPRWRGELQRAAVCDVLATGLSPLARGTRKAWFQSERERRFIPAGAGNSLNITYY
ncbi:Domain of uncharacterised function (DUF2825) [Escherichia coli]|uniref:Domain of uncharacterized function (DUF2825) n=1 Tax=Escherichia coli TaxID=562 RepID=A0A376JJY9_ECOLX|nr:Domain of uncharacterised function (DUF2825) [Escherichia coli]